MAFCVVCGGVLDDDARFCVNCGVEVKEPRPGRPEDPADETEKGGDAAVTAEEGSPAPEENDADGETASLQAKLPAEPEKTTRRGRKRKQPEGSKSLPDQSADAAGGSPSPVDVPAAAAAVDFPPAAETEIRPESAEEYMTEQQVEIFLSAEIAGADVPDAAGTPPDPSPAAVSPGIPSPPVPPAGLMGGGAEALDRYIPPEGSYAANVYRAEHAGPYAGTREIPPPPRQKAEPAPLPPRPEIDREKPLTVGGYFWLAVMYLLPGVGLLMAVILSFAPRSRNIRNLSRAMLILRVVLYVVALILTVVMMAWVWHGGYAGDVLEQFFLRHFR